MDFSFDETQEEVQALAARILGERSTPTRLRELETTPGEWDTDLWGELAKAGLLGMGLPEDVGGAGLGITETALVAQEVGRRTALVPFLATAALAAPAIVRFGTPGQREAVLPAVANGAAVLTGALDESAFRADGDRLTGAQAGVPFAPQATAIVVAADDSLYLVDPDASGVAITPSQSTHRHPAGYVSLDGATAERLGDAGGAAWARTEATAIMCAAACGVLEEALKITAGYISQREQFGKPIATFQGATLRAADAYVDVQATSVTTWAAIWRLATDRPAADEVAMAKFWVADGGQRVVHACQHLHGGIGVDVDYPIHRYFLWAKELELALGGATKQLLAIGASMADAGRAEGSA